MKERKKMVRTNDCEVLRTLLRTMTRKEAIQKVVRELHWDQETVIQALRDNGIPAKNEGGNKVIFHRFDVYGVEAFREFAESFLITSSSSRCDFVEFPPAKEET